jgi:hypothetical protein
MEDGIPHSGSSGASFEWTVSWIEKAIGELKGREAFVG